MTLLARNTDNPKGDLKRTWSWQPADFAQAFLPDKRLSASRLDREIKALLASEDAYEQEAGEWLDAANELHYTGHNWAIKARGIPGIPIEDEDVTDEQYLIDRMESTAISGGTRYIAVYEGKVVGSEYESDVNDPDAVLFLPRRLVALIDRTL